MILVSCPLLVWWDVFKSNAWILWIFTCWFYWVIIIFTFYRYYPWPYHLWRDDWCQLYFVGRGLRTKRIVLGIWQCLALLSHSYTHSHIQNIQAHSNCSMFETVQTSTCKYPKWVNRQKISIPRWANSSREGNPKYWGWLYDCVVNFWHFHS